MRGREIKPQCGTCYGNGKTAYLDAAGKCENCGRQFTTKEIETADATLGAMNASGKILGATDSAEWTAAEALRNALGASTMFVSTLDGKARGVMFIGAVGGVSPLTRITFETLAKMVTPGIPWQHDNLIKIGALGPDDLKLAGQWLANLLMAAIQSWAIAHNKQPIIGEERKALLQGLTECIAGAYKDRPTIAEQN